MRRALPCLKMFGSKSIASLVAITRADHRLPLLLLVPLIIQKLSPPGFPRKAGFA